MKNSSSGGDLLKLLETIKSSEVVENRIQLLMELEEVDLSENTAVNSVVEYLILFWEDFTCLDVSQCTLNKTVLHVAAKCLELDISGCLVQFLVLGIKANAWCRKHLKMTLMSTEDSPEEDHSSFFFQLLLDLLSYSAASYSALARYPVSISKNLTVSIDNFISEQLFLTKELASEIKRIHTLGTELLKAALVTIDGVTRLCRVYCDGVNWDACLAKTEDNNVRDCKEAENGDHIIQITSCTVEKLCELGVVAANDGGSLVSLLNMSWKGVVTLLQFGKGALAVKVNVTSVIMTLISLARESFRCAAQTLSFLEKEKDSEAEAKRIFRLAKFYLINAVRISSHYPLQAFLAYKEITLCVVLILTIRISLSQVENLKSASEILSEIVEPTSFHLINSLLNSTQLKQEDKFEILDWLFSCSSNVSSVADVVSSDNGHISVDEIFSVSCDAMNKDKMLSLGRVFLFLNLVKADLEEDVRLGLSRKLGWLLDILVVEDVYSLILVMRIPVVCGSSEKHELAYRPMFCSVVHDLKTFLIMAIDSSATWSEIESFLIENLFHPHFLCWEIVAELWCFVLRHSGPDMMNDIFDKLCSLIWMTSRESVLFPESALRKTARLICVLATDGPQLMVDRVYSSIFESNRTQYSSSVHTALLMEGFPLNCLSEKNRSTAKQRIVTQYFDLLESFEGHSPGQCDFGVYGGPVFALSAALQSLQVSLSDTEMKTLKFLVSIIRKYKTSTDDTSRENYVRLIGELLGIISSMKHLYSFDEMDGVISELQNLFISKPALSDRQLFLCKPNLACFMAGLGHMEFSDSEDCARNLATWELFHMILRERHWAFVHLAITAFGYFAARTSCNQLWRFLPQDAALSFDVESGNEADEERFMSKLKEFLEKEMACQMLHPSLDHLAMFVKEGRMLKQIVQKNLQKLDSGVISCDMMELDKERQPNKKRKFPDGICRGVQLLQTGLKVMVDGISQCKQDGDEPIEACELILKQFSRLEDVIAHLLSLSGSE
ncbi:uncharacterized protein [Primulina huaijiensis]|uniref:uncharacterized protein n=1 Tax=Primulina huaijiensis TaxID=1492673 RepID=UPI003CC71010